MKYLLLIYTSEKDRAAMSHDERHAMYQDYGKAAREMEERGVMRGGDELADAPAGARTATRPEAGRIARLRERLRPGTSPELT